MSNLVLMFVFSGDIDMTSPVNLPRPRPEHFGSKLWETTAGWEARIAGKHKEEESDPGQGAELPECVKLLRSMPLTVRVNPLLFFYGKATAWFCHGTAAQRGDGVCTANVSELMPAPLCRFYQPQPTATENARSKTGAYWHVKPDTACRLPTLPSGASGLPPSLVPLAVKGLYYCVFPGCRMPTNASRHANQNRGGVVSHVLNDHLGLTPVCDGCGEPYDTTDSVGKHKGRGCTKSPSGNVLLYGYLFPAEYETWGHSFETDVVAGRHATHRAVEDRVREECGAPKKTGGDKKKDK